MKKELTEERNCKNCRYYIAPEYVCMDNYTGGLCLNYNFYEPPEKDPCEIYKNCVLWESKNSKDILDDLL